MRGPTKIAFALIGIAALAAILRFTLFADQVPDRILIQNSLKESIEAGKEGRPGSVVDLLSRSFEVNGYQPGANEVSRLVKQYRPDVEVENQEPEISGDQAVLVSPVRLKIKIAMAEQAFSIKDVKFKFEKEQGAKWLVFPSKDWKLRSIELPADAFSQLGEIGNGMGLFRS